MKTLIATMFAAGAIFAAITPASALSIAPLQEAAPIAASQVAAGCGRGYHRTASGMCRRNVGMACGRGYVLTPHGCRRKTF